jgi:hypothetical protein
MSAATTVCGTAEQLAGLVRRHWAVENELHWCLDVSFREDAQKTAGHAGANLGQVRRVAASLLKQIPEKGASRRSGSVPDGTTTSGCECYRGVLRIRCVRPASL